MNCNTRDTIFFPSGFIPFTGIYSISAPLTNGDRRILGQSYPSARAVVEGIPLPTPTSLFFYGPVELAPGRIFNNVYIPSAEDRVGNYSQFGYIIDPLVGVSFAGGYIPQGRLFVL